MARFAHDRILGQDAQKTAQTTQTPLAQGQTLGPAQVVQVSVATVKREDVPITIQGLGQVQAYNTVTLRARVDGQIEKIGFTEGQDVKAGDLIAEIDPRPFQAALDAAKAKKLQDEATLSNAKLDLERYSALAKQSFASQQQLDTQKSLVNQVTASVAADDAAIESAQVQLNYATLRAPIDGRAGLRLVDAGNMVSAAQQTAVVTISQLQPIAVVFSVPQRDVQAATQSLSNGVPPVSLLNDDGKAIATGKLIATDNQIDPLTGTMKLKAEFANQDHALWPGLSVTAQLTTGIDKGALTVPTEAVQHGVDGLYVYVVDAENHAELRQVKVSQQTPTTAALSDGVKESERVITTGLFLLKPGAPVRVATAATGS